MNKAGAATNAFQLVGKLVEAGKVPDFSGDAQERGEKVAVYLTTVLEGLRDTLEKLDQ